jgi:CRISPR-associated protein Cas5h
MLNLDTREKGITSVDTNVRTIRLPDPDIARQRYAYEFVRKPGYQVDVWLSEAVAMDKLTDHLTEGRAQYAPSLGLSECLARVDPVNVETSVIEGIDDSDTSSDQKRNGLNRDEYGRRVREAPMVEVDSAVPTPAALVEQPGTSVVSERSAGWMERHVGGRRTTGWIDWRLNPSGGPLSTRTGPGSKAAPVRVGDRTVIMT